MANQFPVKQCQCFGRGKINLRGRNVLCLLCNQMEVVISLIFSRRRTYSCLCFVVGRKSKTAVKNGKKILK